MKKQDLLKVVNDLINISIEIGHSDHGGDFIRCLECGREIQGDDKYLLTHTLDCGYMTALRILPELEQEYELIPISVGSLEDISKYSSSYENDVKFKIYGDTGELRSGVLLTFPDVFDGVDMCIRPIIEQVIVKDGVEKTIDFYVYDCVEEIHLLKKQKPIVIE